MRFWVLSNCKGPSNDPRGCIEKAAYVSTHVPGSALEQCCLQEPSLCRPSHTARHLPPDFLSLPYNSKARAHFRDTLWGGMQTSGHPPPGSKLANSEASDHFQMMTNFLYTLKENPSFFKKKKNHLSQFENGRKGKRAGGKVFEGFFCSSRETFPLCACGIFPHSSWHEAPGSVEIPAVSKSILPEFQLCVGPETVRATTYLSVSFIFSLGSQFWNMQHIS